MKQQSSQSINHIGLRDKQQQHNKHKFLSNYELQAENFLKNNEDNIRLDEKISNLNYQGTAGSSTLVDDEDDNIGMPGSGNNSQNSNLSKSPNKVFEGYDNNVVMNGNYQVKCESATNLSVNRQNTKELLKEELASVKLRLRSKEKQLRKTSHDLVRSTKKNNALENNLARSEQIKSALEDKVTKQLMETREVLVIASGNLTDTV